MGGDRLAGRLWTTVTRPGEPAHPIEVVFVAVFGDGRIVRLREVTHPGLVAARRVRRLLTAVRVGSRPGARWSAVGWAPATIRGTQRRRPRGPMGVPVDDVVSIDTLAAVAAVALVAALLVGLLPRLPVPQVVLLLAGGVLIGPDVLGLGSPADVRVLADVGLGFVFLLAGYEIDLRLFREDAGRRALASWAISFGLATGVVGVLSAAGLVEALLPVALALTTTALGTLLPVLREAGLLRGRLGRYLLATGGVGELLPVLVIAVFLGSQGRFTALASLLGVAVLAVALGLLRHGVREGSRLADVVLAGQNETAQITLRGTILLLLTLVAVTDRFHLDAVLGAFLAGLVLRRWVGTAAPLLESKLDAVGYGFFVPLFFVHSGMSLDLHAIAEAPLQLLLFLVLMLAVRGGPVLLVYRGVLAWRERCQTALVSATALPVLVALTEIAVRSGTMTTEDAAALVGAGVVTVLVLPALVVALDRRPAAPARTPPGDPVGPAGPAGPAGPSR